MKWKPITKSFTQHKATYNLCNIHIGDIGLRGPVGEVGIPGTKGAKGDQG